MNFSYLDNFELNKFCELSKRQVTDYLLDYVTKEYESIINCPIDPRPIHVAKTKSHSYQRRTHYNCNDLPSPPLTSSEYNNLEPKINISPITPPPVSHTNKTSLLNHKVSPMPLYNFIEAVMQKSKVDTGTLLLSLSYARRLRLKLYHTSKGMECTHHRIFLASLMIASKYIHDASIKNKYWVDYSLHLFSRTEVNLMEKQLLQLLDYNLEIPIRDFERIANDIVQLYLKQSYNDSAYSSRSNSVQFDANIPLNPLKPSPPSISYL